MSYQQSSGPVLVMQQGPRPNSTFLLDKEIITIGRSSSNDLVIGDDEVSRNHARLVRSGQNWILEDLGSVNGTFVNGQRITGSVTLTPGAQIAFGPTVLFSLQGIPTPFAHRPDAAETLPGSDRVPPGRKGGFPWLLALIAAAGLILLLVIAGAAAFYVLSRRQGGLELTALAASAAPGPDVAFQEPPNNTQARLGEEVLIFALARSDKGVARMELWVDDVLTVEQESPIPEGVTPLSLVHTWVGSTPGMRSFLVRAYDSEGAMGTSPIVYLTVLNQPAEPAQGQYVVQPGDTLESVAEAISITLPSLQEANPALTEPISEGQTIVIIIPTAAPPTPSPTVPPPPPPPPSPTVASPPPPPPPPNYPPNAPQLISATAVDCSVTLKWQDNSDNELGFVVYRAVSGAPTFSALSPTAGATPGTDSVVQYVDEVPRPDDYLYYVVAINAVGQGASNLSAVNVPPSGACVQPPGYKQVIFEPLTVQPNNPAFSSAALYYMMGGFDLGRRIPPSSGTSIAVGDWSGMEEAVPSPSSLYLEPTAPVLLSVHALGWPGSTPLGDLLKAHPPSQMLPAVIWHGDTPGPAGGFGIDYHLWLENVTWGAGSTILIPPPTNLRLATTVAELDKIAACTGGFCDPATDRALVWDWTGPTSVLEGYILYRFYSCPGADTPIPAPDQLSKYYGEGKMVPAWTVPSGCAARYQVSAFGPTGESPPSAPLDIAASAATVRLPVTFQNLTIKGLPVAGAFRELTLNANQYLFESASTHYMNGLAKDLSGVILNDKAPNNFVRVGLGPGDALQIGFNVVNPTTWANLVTYQQTFLPPPGNDWSSQAGVHHLNPTADYDLTVVFGTPEVLAAGEVARPQSDLQFMSPGAFGIIGTDIYIAMLNFGPDDLLGSKLQLTTYWIDPVTTLPVNSQTVVRTITARAWDSWECRADSIPSAYLGLSPLPVFHAEWSAVDFDYIGTEPQVAEAPPLPW